MAANSPSPVPIRSSSSPSTSSTSPASAASNRSVRCAGPRRDGPGTRCAAPRSADGRTDRAERAPVKPAAQCHRALGPRRPALAQERGPARPATGRYASPPVPRAHGALGIPSAQLISLGESPSRRPSQCCDEFVHVRFADVGGCRDAHPRDRSIRGECAQRAARSAVSTACHPRCASILATTPTTTSTSAATTST